MDAGRKRVACFGGGTGLPSLLSGLKHNPRLEVTAIVSMFDTGGSSGELRDRFGILPPGDVLKCLLALAEDESAARKILLKRVRHLRFPGHTGGNMLLMALEKVYGAYPEAVDALAQILSARGRVVPVTLAQSALTARYADGTVHRGETNVDAGVAEGKEVRELLLHPPVAAAADALRAIETAHALCMGPGSFFTSVLPNFLPDGVRERIAVSKAPIIFIANFLTEGMGMRGWTLMRIVGVLERFVGRCVSAIVANQRLPSAEILERYDAERKLPILPDSEARADARLVAADLWDDSSLARHDPARLGRLVSDLIQKSC